LLIIKDLYPIYKPFYHRANVVLTAAFFSSLVFVSSAVRAQDEEVRVLPSVTVFATRGPDNEVTQRSEVEWDTSNDSTIKKESDGVYTVGDTTNPYSVKSLILSLGSPEVNFDIKFAKNSATMTADGRSMLSTLIDTLGHLDEGTTISLTPVNSAIQNSKNITQRRFDSLRGALLRNKKINVKFLPSEIKGSKSKLDEWRIKVKRVLK